MCTDTDMEIYGVKVDKSKFHTYRLEWNPIVKKNQCQKCGAMFSDSLPEIGWMIVDANHFSLHSCRFCGKLLANGPLD